MPKAKIIPKQNSVFCSVAKPTADSPRQWRELQGAIMARESSENYANWWGIFCEMYDECVDTPRRRKGNR